MSISVVTSAKAALNSGCINVGKFPFKYKSRLDKKVYFSVEFSIMLFALMQKILHLSK